MKLLNKFYFSIKFMKYPTKVLSDLHEIEVKKFNQNKKIRLETINCINCNSSNYKELYTNDRFGINQQTVMCNTCALVYSNPRMSEESLLYFYSSNLYRQLYEKSDDSEYLFPKKTDFKNMHVIIRRKEKTTQSYQFCKN